MHLPERIVTPPPPPGVAWLCRHHAGAGLSTDPPCCAEATPIGPGDRSVWFALRLAAKPLEVRVGIRAASADPMWSLSVLAGHAYQHRKTWWWGRARAW